MKQAEATADRIKDFYRRKAQGCTSASLLFPLGSPFLNYHSPPPPSPKQPFRLHSPQGSPSPLPGSPFPWPGSQELPPGSGPSSYPLSTALTPPPASSQSTPSTGKTCLLRIHPVSVHQRESPLGSLFLAPLCPKNPMFPGIPSNLYFSFPMGQERVDAALCI